MGLKTLIKRTKELIGNAESGNSNAKRMDFMTKVMMEMANGPHWCGEVQKTLDNFCKESLLGALKQIIPILEEDAAASTSPK